MRSYHFVYSFLQCAPESTHTLPASPCLTLSVAMRRRSKLPTLKVSQGMSKALCLFAMVSCGAATLQRVCRNAPL